METISSDTTIANPEEILEKFKKDSAVKSINFNVPFKPNVCLYDISLNSRGQEEDKVYAFNQWYRTYVRRGNTIIRIFDDHKNIADTFYGRKGFEKFFDLMYEYIQCNLGEIKGLDQKFRMEDVDEHSNLHNIIFSQVQKTFENNNKILVYKLVKANGENAQISWIESLQSWIIASKNVSLLARNDEDINEYKGDRFNFAKMIAKEWFRIVNKLENEGTIKELKEYMNNKTFVGEYCGNQNYQHLVKYTTTDIHFFAIVNNKSTETCISPSEAFNIFKKYNLTHVNCQSIGMYKDWEQLNQELKKIYIDVAKANIDSEEEGAVIYLVGIDDTLHERTLSLSKLKTLEYRIYRKLREKLKSFIGHKRKSSRPWEENYKAFCQETEGLCEEIKPPMPLSYYFHLAREAFEFGENNPKKVSIIQDKYITFVSALIYSLSKNEKLHPSIFDKEETIQQILQIPWAESYKNYKAPENIQLGISEKKVIPAKKTKVYVIVPVGIPGMGKTYFLEVFQKVIEANDCKLSVVSSDKVRKECMEKLAKSNKRLSKDQLFEKTGRDARDLFNDRLQDIISNSHKIQSKAVFVFIDKNHPPNAIKGTLEFIKNSSHSQLDVQTIALAPQMENSFFTYEDQGKTYFYPFSPNFFFHCFERVQTRNNHETLSGGGAKSVDVLIMFLQMFRNIKLDQASVLKNGFDKLMEIPFTNELSPAQVPPEFINILIQALNATPPGSKCKDQGLITKLNEFYEQNRIQFLNPEASAVEAAVHKFFQDQVLPEINRVSEIGDGHNNHEIEEAKDEKLDSILDRENEEYNPPTLPLYLGIYTLQNPVAEVKDYMIRGIDLLMDKFTDDQKLQDLYQSLLNGGPNDLHFTSDFHITSLFIGKDKSKRNTKLFKTFKPGHKMDIELVGLVIIPDKIVTAICFPDKSTIKIENRFPHMTIMKGQWAPKFSNDVFEALFGGDGPLNKEYNSGEFLSRPEFTYKAQVKISCGAGTAYVVKTTPNLVLPSEARSSDCPP